MKWKSYVIPWNLNTLKEPYRNAAERFLLFRILTLSTSQSWLSMQIGLPVGHMLKFKRYWKWRKRYFIQGEDQSSLGQKKIWYLLLLFTVFLSNYSGVDLIFLKWAIPEKKKQRSEDMEFPGVFTWHN